MSRHGEGRNGNRSASSAADRRFKPRHQGEQTLLLAATLKELNSAALVKMQISPVCKRLSAFVLQVATGTDKNVQISF